MATGRLDGEPWAEPADSDDWGDDAATFGDRLAHARERASLSQAELAHRMGIRLQTVRNWEENRSEPRANRLQMLAGMLNVPMVWLMSGQGTAPAGEAEAGDAAWCAGELRALRLEAARLADRLGRLERRLRRGPA